jgi:DNA-binding response OmpR family regulator
MPKKTVLLAEDESIVSLDLKMFLKRNSFEVNTVTSGTQMLNLYKSVKPGLIISDFNGGGSPSFQDAIRTISKIDGTPIIIISGLSHNTLENFTSEIINSTFLTKPFDNSCLLEVINKLLPR